MVAQGVEFFFIEVVGGGFGGPQVMVLLSGLVDASGRDGCGESSGNGFAVVEGDFDVRHPHAHGGSKNSSTHREGQYEKAGRHRDAACRAGSILRAQIQFKNGKWHQILGENQKSEERALKRSRIETEGPFKEEKR